MHHQQSDQRSLAAEFEKLCSTTINSSNNESSQNDESFETAKPAAAKSAVEGKPSPNSVLEFDPDEEEGLPHFELHPDLQGKLSQETLDRVAVYHIIKSINGYVDLFVVRFHLKMAAARVAKFVLILFQGSG